VSSDLIELILQRLQETAALLRRLRHAPDKKVAAAKAGLAASEPLGCYPRETVSPYGRGRGKRLRGTLADQVSHSFVFQGRGGRSRGTEARMALHRVGKAFGGAMVRVIEKYPSTAGELAGMPEPSYVPKDIGLVWPRRLWCRGLQVPDAGRLLATVAEMRTHEA
jgi:hypothetical protein